MNKEEEDLTGGEYAGLGSFETIIRHFERDDLAGAETLVARLPADHWLYMHNWLMQELDYRIPKSRGRCLALVWLLDREREWFGKNKDLLTGDDWPDDEPQ